MGRWEPNALERLREAAMELFLERGYDRTTVSEIAARAKLTERTFFRYFSEKREVLFSGSAPLEELVIGTIAGAPKTTPPLEAVTAGFEATAPMFEARRAHARERRALIAAHTELHERELVKLARLTAVIAACLRERGLSPAAASLVAEIGMAIFKSAFERWLDGSKRRDLAYYVRATLADLRRVR